jgi:hypothetical protein
MSPLSPRHHNSDLNLEGSELMLRPSAPVYCLDLDPAALGSSTVSTVGSTTGGTPFGSTAAASEAAAAAGAGLADLSFSGLYSGRRGYRLQGYAAAAAAGPIGTNSSSSRRSLAQNATVPGLSTPAAAPAGPADVADANAVATASRPGRFWPGPSAGLGVSAAGTFSIAGSSIGSSRGLLTGMPSGLGVGPGGLLVGPTAAGGGVGVRPRPKSSHTAAVESIGRRQAALQVCDCQAWCAASRLV